jgi:tight adherence protein B
MSLKLAALVLLWVGWAAFVFVSSSPPRGVAYRIASSYVAGLDADFRAMFLPRRGRELGWLQVTLVIACLALYGARPEGALVVLATAIAVGPRIAVTIMVRRRRARIDDQAHGFALALANMLKTTASVGDALRLTLDVTPAPIRQEIETALREVRVGSTLEGALLAAAARAGSSALDVVVSALLIGHKTGGDLPRILEGTAASLRELKRLEELTDRVTSSAKQSVAVAACITLGLAICLPRVMHGFFEPLRTTTKGQIIAVQLAALYLFALFLGWRFTRKSI